MRLRVGAAQLNTTVGDLDANALAVIEAAQRARQLGADLVCFPELALCGYPPEDLLLRPAFTAEAEEAIAKVAAAVRDIVLVVGTVHRDGDLYNAAAICWGGRVVGYYHKQHLPNYGVFDERRYFKAGRQAGPLLRLRGVTIGVTICEDVWVPDGPLLEQARAGAELALNINGSPFHRGKQLWRRSMLATRASDAAMPLVFLNLVGGQDELVFDGGSMLFDAEGTLVASAPQFEEALCVWDVDCTDAFRRRLRDTRPRAWEPLDLPTVDIDALSASERDGGDVVPIDAGAHAAGHAIGADHEVLHLHAVAALPPLPAENQSPLPALDRCEEVYRALVLGTRDYLRKNGFGAAVLGLSGGVDSSLVAAVAVDAVGAENVAGIAMPSPYSSEGSVTDARALAENLGIRLDLVPISDVFTAMLSTVEPLFADRKPDVTEENIQARLRGTILMAFSNKFGALLLTTGNKSEMAVGYCTLYGDMAGGYAVIKDVPKTLVYDLCRWRNARAGAEVVPASVLEKPPSAELRPDQRDTDSLPPYEVLDPVIEAYVERDLVASEIVARRIGTPEVVDRVIRLIDASEYKRRQAPPGVRITPKAFGRDWRLPLTNRFRPLSGD